MKVYTTLKIVIFSSLLLMLGSYSTYAQCGFTANQTSGCAGFVLNVRDTTPNSTNTLWTFTYHPAGTTRTFSISSGPNLQAFQLMDTCGTVDVKMTTTVNGVPCVVNKPGYITVYCKPIVKGILSPTNACIGVGVNYTDQSLPGVGCPGPLSYTIDMGQGVPCHSPPCLTYYNRNGTYCPLIQVTNSCGCSAYDTIASANCVKVTAPPTASFTGTNLSSCASPLISTMTANASGSNTKYFWYVAPTGTGSYTLYQSSGSNVFSHIYSAGTWDIKLVAKDSLSFCADTAVRVGYVSAGTAQSAAFTIASPSGGCIPLTVTLHPLTTSGNTYAWSTSPSGGVLPSGGNITNANNSDVTFTYNNAGTYSLRLIVADGTCLDTLTIPNAIHAGVPPVVRFTNTDTTSCTVPDTAVLTYTGPNPSLYSYSWSINNSSTTICSSNIITNPTGSSTSVIFNCPGVYTPVLTVTDTASGCQSTLFKTFKYVLARLIAKTAITKLNGSACVNDTFRIRNITSPGPFASVQWVFGPDANVIRIANNDTAYVSFPASGCHKYSLIVRSVSGCIDTLRDSICVSTKPRAIVSVSPLDMCYNYGCNTFSTIIPNTTDTPTFIRVWPQGTASSVIGVNFTLDTPIFSKCYVYQDYGNFIPCYVPFRNGCAGDTVCITDTVHIRPPVPAFVYRSSCRQPNVITYTDASRGADSIVWEIFDGSTYTTYTNQSSITITYPTSSCGIKYPVKLTAYNDTTGCHVSKFDTITIACYGVDFTAQTQKGCLPDVVVAPFADSLRLYTTNPINMMPNRIVWDFNVPTAGPNFNAALPSELGFAPVATYDTAGVYKVCAQVNYPNGCVDTLCKPKYINVSQPIAALTTSANGGCVPFCVRFTNSSFDNFGLINSACITYGDTVGVTYCMPPNTMTHCFDSVRLFSVTLTVTDTNSCVDQATVTIQGNKIVSSFVISDTLTCTQSPSPLNPVTFNSTSTGFGLQYKWIFPADAVNITSPTSPSTTAQFTTQGTKRVCLAVTDQYGACKDTACKNLLVKNPVADYTMMDSSFTRVKLDTFFSCPPGTVYLKDLSLYGIDSVAWDFGDGRSDFSNPTGHSYRYPGCYPIKHVVTSTHGCKDSVTKYQVCLAGPQITMTASSRGGCPCFPVSFYVRSVYASSMTFITGGNSYYNGNPTGFINYNLTPVGTPSSPRIDTLSLTYCSAGDVRPGIIAIDSLNGCTVYYDSLIVPLISDSFSASYTSQVVGCGTNYVCFTNNTVFKSIYATTAYQRWNFGDGSPIDTTSTPCHQFTSPGFHRVSLFVRDNVGCYDSVVRDIYIPRAPIAKFTLDDSVGCRPLTLQFRDSSFVDSVSNIVSGYWDFGDVPPVRYNTFRDTTYTYLTPNTPPSKYTATLVVRDVFGCTDTARRNIQVNAPPTVNHESPITICLGDTVSLNGIGSDTIRWVTTYNISDTMSATPRVWPVTDTSYILRVGHENRCFVFDTVVLNVSKVTAQYTVAPVCLNQSSLFDATATVSTHSPVSTYTWQYGDGTSTGSGITSNHTYSTYNVYSDTLIVINSIGCRDTAYGSSTVYDLPNAKLGLSDSSVCLGTCITLTDLSTPGASAAISQSNFDVQNDGVVDYTTSPSQHCYASSGNYTVRLIVMDNNLCRDTADRKVVVHSIPVASFNNDSNCINVDNVFESNTILGDGPIKRYLWSIGGTGQPEDSSMIVRAFPNAGIYTVCLRTTDVYGCFDDTCKAIQVFASAIDTVTPLDTTICVGYSAAFQVKGSFDRVEWVPSAWVDNPTGANVVITPKQTIRYNVLSYYKQCPPKVDTVNIWVIDSVPVSASADPQNIVLGLSSNVTSTVKGTIDSIVWDPDSTLSCRSCRNPIATPSATTTYTATVYYTKNKVTCSNRTQVTITVFRSCDNSLIYIPNTFTPNNDGNNDVFRIRGQGITKVNYFRVFDRWGKIVYEANNVDDTNDAAWNGCFNNDKTKPVNSDVFVYLFEVECVTGQKINGKGNVTLIR